MKHSPCPLSLIVTIFTALWLSAGGATASAVVAAAPDKIALNCEVMNAYQQKILPQALGGNTEAQFKLAQTYVMGCGEQAANDGLAFTWYEKAATAGFVKAQFMLGLFYEKGTGVPLNLAQALFWYHKAGVAGDVRAQVALGRFYETGLAVKANKQLALEWYEKASAQGDVAAAAKVIKLSQPARE